MATLLFLDANIIIAASIEGEVSSKLPIVRHWAAEECKKLFEHISTKVENGEAVAFVSFIAEEEARNNLASAIGKSINECWKELDGLGTEERVRTADQLDLFRRACSEQLNENLSLLGRKPVQKDKFSAIESKVNSVFEQLQKNYDQEANRMEWSKPAAKGLWGAIHAVAKANRELLGPKTFKPDIEQSDKRILAEAIATSPPNSGTVFV